MATNTNTPNKPSETIPLWLAVGITVLLSMPFGLWLENYNFALWCSFVVWANYFALGAQPACIRIIIPSFSYAVAMTMLTLWSAQFLTFLPSLRTEGDLSLSLALFVGMSFTVYTMKFSRIFQEGSLPFFNGISMAIGVLLTGSFPTIDSSLPVHLVAGIWTVLMGIFGCVLGFFNVWLTFPKAEEQSP